MIIGLVGFAGSGKGTVADYLVTKHNYVKMAFADPLKDAASVIFGWPRYMVEGDNEPSRIFRETPDPFWSEKFDMKFTPRLALQKLGTEAGRDVFHKDIWVYALENRIRQHKNVVIADVRFDNEIAAIVKWGGHIIRIKRGKEPIWYETAYNHIHNNIYEMYQLYPNIHVSEWAWIGNENIKTTITNNSSVQNLESEVEKYLTSITSPANI
jgi:hypothetical protein